MQSLKKIHAWAQMKVPLSELSQSLGSVTSDKLLRFIFLLKYLDAFCPLRISKHINSL